MQRVVLAYSGGLVSSAAIGWLAQQRGVEVVTVTIDFGQERELAAVRERALALGAVRAHVVDAREEFVQDYMLPALQAGALKDGYALSSPLVARRLVDIARMEAATAVAHGGEPGTDVEAALHTAIRSLDPALEVIAPARAWGMTEVELVTFARKQGVHVPPPSRYRIDASLWGRVVTASSEAPMNEDVFTLTREVAECPDEPAFLEIHFAAGVPVRANGVEMSMIELIESLETIAGAHGVGRTRSGSAVIEAPAATVLAAAHHDLETHVVGADLARLKEQLSHIYSDAMAGGRWFSDIRIAIDAFTDVLQPRVEGAVTLELLKGKCTVMRRVSPHAAAAGHESCTSKEVA
ncbi:MAG: argininosuccinate synthase [Acidobacteria bacterium]|nr:argininosuccinate synthase [Acidobacteriota bacterium]